MPALETISQELRYAARGLAKNKAFTAVAVLTLALGIGANTAIFSVIEGVLLTPLPYHDPERLVVAALYNRALKYPTDLSYPDFLDWQRESRSFEQIAAFRPQGHDLTSPGAPEHLDGKQISANFFSTLGVKLALGRELSPDEDRFGGPPAVVISNRLWRDRFGASPVALGKTVTMYGYDLTIVGVLPPGFRFGGVEADVYTSLGRAGPFRGDRTVHDILCIARLQPRVNIDQARAELNAVQDNIDRLNPATERGQGAYLDSLKHFFTGDVSATLFLLLGAVGLLLLIACANVANLLLARSAARAHEFALCLALGASRPQLVRQSLTESSLLAIAGGALGLAIANWGVRIVLAVAPATVPRSASIGVNTAVFLFAVGVSLATGIVFGLVPGFRNSSIDVQAGLKQAGRGLTGGNQRTQRGLVIVQIALALILLTGGSLLFRSIRNLLAVNPGFDARHVVTFQVGLSPSIASSSPKLRVAYQRLTERIRQIPGVEAAGITALVPMGQGANEGPYWVGAQQPASMAEIPRAIWYPTGPDYVTTMAIPLLRGRLLSPTDTVNSEPVVLIDSLLARRSFPDRDPLGRTITVPHWGAVRNLAVRIVGVVGHVKHYGLDGSDGEKPQIYYSFYQLPDDVLPVFASDLAIAVRTPLETASLMPAIRAAVSETGSDRPVYNVHSMQELVSESMGKQRFPMFLLTAFAGLALLLASVGTYGAVAYSTARRMGEIGIRFALGARFWVWSSARDCVWLSPVSRSGSLPR
jgi:predicted permease